jgi:epoxyqueuosine reductase
MAQSRVSFSDQVRDTARRLGFDAVGIARASIPLDGDFLRYEEFVGQGMHGEMGWLARHVGVRARLDGDGILVGAKSVICVARRYPHRRGPRSTQEGASEDALVRGIALYARGQDYHRFVRRRLRRLASFVRSLGTADQPVVARPLCDEEPVLERAWAVRAGLGFIGKNGMLIVPGLGSMVLLGEVVTTLELDESIAATAGPVEERCGSCTRCLDACPTQAFASAYVLDPRRCVSYLTIEHRSAVAPELREGIGTHLFGCDDCQTVCPFNAGRGALARHEESGRKQGVPHARAERESGRNTQRVPHARAERESGRNTKESHDPFAPLERWSQVRLETLLSLDHASWGILFAGTPLKRAGRAGIARNAAIVLGNRRAKSALPALRAAANSHDDPWVREAASWAVARIEQK